MITPIILPVTVYAGDDFDLQLCWRIRCGSPYDLSLYAAKFTFWPTKVNRTTAVYQVTNPQASGNGIALSDVSPNIWVHIIEQNTTFDPIVPLWYILELQTPPGSDPAVDGVWFRFANGKVDYEV